MVRSSCKPLGTVGQGGFDGGLEGGVGWVATFGKILVLDLPPDTFDRIQFGTVGWEEAEVDARGSKSGSAAVTGWLWWTE